MWGKPAEQILESIARYRKRINQSGRWPPAQLSSLRVSRGLDQSQGAPGTRIEDALLNAYWHEYETLREELLLTIRSRNQILSFALGASGLVLGASVLTAADNGKSTFIFWTTFAVLPILLACIYALWCSEFLRMVRASQHLAIVERAINNLIAASHDAQRYLADRVSLSWEIYLRTPDPIRNKDRVPRWPPRRFYEEWQKARDLDGYWRGTATVDLHVPFSIVMGLFILGVQYMGNLALEGKTPLWHWFPGPGFWLFVLQAYVFGHAKVVYSAAIDFDDVRKAVNEPRDGGGSPATAASQTAVVDPLIAVEDARASGSA